MGNKERDDHKLLIGRTHDTNARPLPIFFPEIIPSQDRSIDD